MYINVITLPSGVRIALYNGSAYMLVHGKVVRIGTADLVLRLARQGGRMRGMDDEDFSNRWRFCWAIIGDAARFGSVAAGWDHSPWLQAAFIALRRQNTFPPSVALL